MAIPREIAENAVRLYRDCLRMADYLGRKQGNRAVLREQVRLQFKKNMDERDPDKIQAQKEAAVRGLSNYMVFEATRMARADRGTPDG
ncbi:hypothetical protein KFL_007610060 [Klebsormidium nitens]|uniref:Complex 1 LYR protein domain-containing protein n=1 Tax=Klebsormidium nitens TaxID=105231 RepID=A0A1Y1IKT5_KLENI|nr:hypothetical protein KFL_007610060 [Klebsormidium nitens]|eukprot:GAQ91303.1 hypothetical protein KFL_007610060 [Klebsormidium nitens]